MITVTLPILWMVKLKTLRYSIFCKSKTCVKVKLVTVHTLNVCKWVGYKYQNRDTFLCQQYKIPIHLHFIAFGHDSKMFTRKQIANNARSMIQNPLRLFVTNKNLTHQKWIKNIICCRLYTIIHYEHLCKRNTSKMYAHYYKSLKNDLQCLIVCILNSLLIYVRITNIIYIFIFWLKLILTLIEIIFRTKSKSAYLAKYYCNSKI
jgi:hypothetical protein